MSMVITVRWRSRADGCAYPKWPGGSMTTEWGGKRLLTWEPTTRAADGDQAAFFCSHGDFRAAGTSLDHVGEVASAQRWCRYRKPDAGDGVGVK